MDSNDEDEALTTFAAYVSAHDISISPLIQPHRFESSGIGIRAAAFIPRKTRLMHVPTRAVLKWSDVPEAFLPCAGVPPPAPLAKQEEEGGEKEGGGGGGKRGMRVHSRLACWLAFGEGEVRERYGAWMATWPRIEEFRKGMPGLWPESLRSREVCYLSAAKENDGVTVEGSGRVNVGKRRKREAQKSGGPRGFALLPPGITGQWATLRTSGTDLPRGNLAVQQTKFDGDLAAAAQHFPELEDRSSPTYQKFLHAWCCVNTRCFYYWPTWPTRKDGTGKPLPPPPAPEDRDEAMALCPGMDFFNHTVDDDDGGLCCSVDYDEEGFTVVSPDAPVKAGEELFISYGAHTEDDLWVEYGFMLGGDTNSWDSIDLDAVVLNDSRLDEKQKQLLEELSYYGGYTLRRDGVCWRTEMAARKCFMSTERWVDIVDGSFDETEAENETAVGIVVEWIMKLQVEARNSLEGLEEMSKADLIDTFTQPDDGEERETTGLARREMCLKRWTQIDELCTQATRAVQEGI